MCCRSLKSPHSELSINQMDSRIMHAFLMHDKMLREQTMAGIHGGRTCLSGDLSNLLPARTCQRRTCGQEQRSCQPHAPDAGWGGRAVDQSSCLARNDVRAP